MSPGTLPFVDPSAIRLQIGSRQRREKSNPWAIAGEIPEAPINPGFPARARAGGSRDASLVRVRRTRSRVGVLQFSEDSGLGESGDVSRKANP